MNLLGYRAPQGGFGQALPRKEFNGRRIRGSSPLWCTHLNLRGPESRFDKKVIWASRESIFEKKSKIKLLLIFPICHISLLPEFWAVKRLKSQDFCCEKLKIYIPTKGIVSLLSDQVIDERIFWRPRNRQTHCSPTIACIMSFTSTFRKRFRRNSHLDFHFSAQEITNLLEILLLQNKLFIVYSLS